ncbi:VCBS domain-containing protein [Deefgea rivuli]|uniref:VCBS domain-containing protein n=1 Tax=Deefgea rivuli TaxID=400948 RepID=UPI000A840EC2|nr:VCBS domain-containing protein [Deefgea rivuli]
MQLTGFDAATGKVTYSYDPSVQANVGGKDVIDNIAITVTDKNNVVGTDSLDIAIQDTVPTANADTNSILENTATTTGNVILGDAKGGVADINSSDTGLTLTTAGTFVGKYGTLVIAANGTYTYTLDNANPTVNALNPGQSLTDEVFNYTVRDADGSTSSASLNITVNGASDGGPTVSIPDTDGNAGANASDKTVVESDGPIAGDFSVTAPDGIKEINVGGTVITAAQLATLGTTPITINTGEGSLQLTGFDAATGKVTYSYDPSVQANVGGKDVIDNIAITVTDKNNVVGTDSLDIAIQDTVPTANADSNSILENTATTSGNVILGDAKGGVADTNSSDTGLTLTTAGTFVGKYGTLVIAANGTYTYTLDNANPTVNALNPGQSLTDEVFNYTVRDADGSTSTAKLTLTINGASDGGPTVSIPDTDGNAGANASDKTVVESDGPVTGDFSVTAPDGIKEINVGGTVITAAQLATLGTTPITINTGEGVLQLTGFDAATGKVTYSYDPSVQANVGGKDVLDNIAITITDKNNVVGTDSLDIAIQDTVPTANADTNSILENTATTSGNVILGDAKGGVADTNSSDTGLTLTTAGTFVGKYGTLVIAANGTYTYTLDNANPTVNALNPGQSLTDEVFNYTVRDADGSTSSATLNITVNGASDGGPTVSIPDTDGNAGANASDKTVIESDGPVIGDFSVTAPDGIKEINVGGTVITAAQLATLGTTPITINTGEGVLQLTGFNAATGKVTYSYDPSVQANVGGKDVIDNIAITVTDKNNVVGTDSLDIAIQDTVPTANADTNSILENTATTTGNVILGDAKGGVADTNSSDTGLTLTTAGTFVGKYGTLVIAANGTYTYTLDNANPTVNALNLGQSLTDEVFNYTVRDADGSTSSASLNITVNGTNDAPVLDLDASGAGTGFRNTYVENGTGVAIADVDSLITDVDSANLQTATITLSNTQVGDVLSFTGLPAGITGSSAIVGGNIVITLTGNASKATYETALEAIRFSNTSDSPSTVDRVINVVVNDGTANSNTAVSTISVTAVNDAPVLDLDASAAGTGFTTTYVENAAGVAIADVDSLITDVDSANLQTATITLSNTQVGDVLSFTGLPAGITGSSAIVGGNIVITLTGNASKATYETALEAIRFSNTSDAPSTVDRIINVVVNDGALNSNTAVSTIKVTAVNDAPDAIDDPATLAGLKSEYFAYSEGNDGGNLTSLAMVNAFIATHSASAVFTAKKFDYSLANGDLGANGNLQTFLGSDAASLNTDPGNTSDAIIRMTGNITLAAGTYNFKVLADDGYVIYIDGQKVAEIDKNQSPTGTEHATFNIATGGNHTIEILYWDQGGQAVFKPELRQGTDAYQSLGNFILSSQVPYSTSEDTALTLSPAALLANDKDPDGDVLTITSVQGATHGSVALVNGNVVFTPAANYTGPASFTYTISDGKGGSDTATVSLQVTAVNDAPVSSNQSVNTPEDTTFNGQVIATDVDTGDKLSYVLKAGTAPTNGTVTIDAATGAYVYKPNANYNGGDTFTVTISDGHGGTVNSVVTINVTPVNDVPVLDLDASGAGTGYTNTYVENATGIRIVDTDSSVIDVDNANLQKATITLSNTQAGDVLSFTGLPTGITGSSAIVGGNIVITLTGNVSKATYETALEAIRFSNSSENPSTVDRVINIVVNDGTADSNTAVSTIKVTAVNDAAVIGGTSSGQVQEDTNVVAGKITTGGQLTIGDVDSPALFVAQTNTAGTYGSLSIDTTGKWVYTLNNSAANVQALNTADHKIETFTVQSSDGTSKTITVNVDGLDERYNTAPVAADDFSFTKLNQAVSLNVLANDRDLQNDSLTLVGLPTVLTGQGAITISPTTGFPIFTPTNGFIGDATIQYTVNDGFGGTSTAIWTVKVVPTGNVLDGSGEGGVGSYYVRGPESGTGDVIDVATSAYYIAGGGAVGGAQYTSTSTGNDQVILTGGSNDHVEAGAGNDLIYMGETQDINNSVAVKDVNYFLNSKFMNDADGTLSTAANNDKLVQGIVQEMQPVADLVNAGSGNDTVFGENGSDSLYGNTGNDKLFGGAGLDALRGGAGNDLLVGGAGDDILRGDAGSDTFKWTLGDQGTAGTPARDIVMDFNNAKSGNAASDTDKLDLRDLLQGENSGSLTQYLHFEKSGSDTIVHVSSKGEFAGSNWTAKEDQVITLQGVDLTTAGNDQQIITDLLNKGRLITD